MRAEEYDELKDVFHKVLLYCLIEQDFYNEDDFNKLQFVEKVAGIKLQ